MTKTERYDLLTQFMGLSRQIEVQKRLRRVQRQFHEHVDALETQRRELVARLTTKLGGPCATFDDALAGLRPHLQRHSIPLPASLSELRAADVRLRDMVAADPRAAAIAQLNEVNRLLQQIGSAHAAAHAMTQLAALGQPFADLTDQLRGLALLALLEKGREAIASSGDASTCPLCGQAFTGNLAAHLDSELESLRALKAAHTQSTAALKDARDAFRELRILPRSLPPLVDAIAQPSLQSRLQSLSSTGNALQQRLDAIEKALPQNVEHLSADYLRRSAEDAKHLTELQEALDVATTRARNTALEIISLLQADGTRLQLVHDYELVHDAVEGLPDIARAQASADRSAELAVELDSDIEDYVRACVEDVQTRFDQIAGDVAVYFAVLEELTPGLERPALRILEDQDRSVVFEVALHGHLVSPAYKYLSESQLNSFGLAVFLASVRRFNPHFGFFILDDVVNSLDGHKRPQLLKLLKLHFADRQVLLLTHDSSWRDRIARELPQWKRLHFQRYDPGIGPILASAPTSVEQVRRHLQKDEPKTAGQILGPLIEDELQEFAEATETELKFNRRNEYTLEPLLNGLKRRLESKLKADHPVALAAKALAENAGFRNLCAHAKDPAIDITTEEVQLALDAWLALSTHLRCPVKACSDALRWNDPEFRCPCGTTVLRKVP